MTVVTHELGHVLGLPDLDPADHPHDVMAGRLETGVARHAFRADSTPSRNGLAPWLDRTQTADRLFDRLGESVDSAITDAPRPSRELRFASVSAADGRIAWTVAERDDPESFDRRGDDEEDAITADAVFEELLAECVFSKPGGD